MNLEPLKRTRVILARGFHKKMKVQLVHHRSMSESSLSSYQGFYQASLQQSVQKVSAICSTGWTRTPSTKMSQDFQQGRERESSLKLKALRRSQKWVVFICESPAHVGLGSSPISKNFLLMISNNPSYAAANQ